MSDVQPVPPIKLGSEATSSVWVNCNKVLQEALQLCEKKDLDRLVLRCADLPAVYGSAGDLRRLFFGLLHVILKAADETAKLFLHIHCVPEENSQRRVADAGYFSIQFVTHLVPTKAWPQAHQQLFAEANAILQQHNGSLSLNVEGEGCCLFSVSLPGKPL